jgi:hypothetical protein
MKIFGCRACDGGHSQMIYAVSRIRRDGSLGCPARAKLSGIYQ